MMRHGPSPHTCGVVGCPTCADATRRAERVERGRVAIEAVLAPYGAAWAAEPRNIALALDGLAQASAAALPEAQAFVRTLQDSRDPLLVPVLIAWIAAEHEPADEEDVSDANDHHRAPEIDEDVVAEQARRERDGAS